MLAKRIRDDCNYTASLGIAGGYYDGPRAYNLQIQFLISPAGRSEWDKNFYELAWKAHKEQGPLPNNCSVSDFETPVDAFIELIQPYRAASLPAMEAMEHIINMMPPMYVTEKWMLKSEAVSAGWYVDMATVRDKCVFHIKRDQKQQKAEPLLIAAPEYLTAVASAEELVHFSEVIGYSFDVGRAHSSMTLRSSKPLGSPLSQTNLGLGAVTPSTSTITRNEVTYTFVVWCPKCPHPGEPPAQCYADPECEMVVKPAVWTNETAKKEILKLHSDNQKYLPAGKKAGRLLAPPKKEQEEYLKKSKEAKAARKAKKAADKDKAATPGGLSMDLIDNEFIQSLGGLMDVSDANFQSFMGLSLPTPEQLSDMSAGALADVHADVQGHQGEWLLAMQLHAAIAQQQDLPLRRIFLGVTDPGGRCFGGPKPSYHFGLRSHRGDRAVRGDDPGWRQARGAAHHGVGRQEGQHEARGPIRRARRG